MPATSANSGIPEYERSLFPTAVPKDVKALLQHVSNIEKNIFRKYLKVGLTYLQKSQSDEEYDAAFENICTALNCSSEEEAWVVAEQYSGVVTLLRALLRLRAKTLRRQHLEDMLKGMGFRDDQTSDLCKIVFGPARQAIEEHLTACNPILPSPERLNWNLQLCPASEKHPHVVELAVALDMDIQKDTCKMSLNLQQFHELRCTVAGLLHQMEVLKTTSAHTDGTRAKDV